MIVGLFAVGIPCRQRQEQMRSFSREMRIFSRFFLTGQLPQNTMPKLDGYVERCSISFALQVLPYLTRFSRVHLESLRYLENVLEIVLSLFLLKEHTP